MCGDCVAEKKRTRKAGWDALYIVACLVLVLLLPPFFFLIPENLKGRGEGSLRAVLVYRIGLRLTGGCMYVVWTGFELRGYGMG